MSWALDDRPNIDAHAKGTFGFTLYGTEGILYRQEPYFESKSGSVTVEGEVVQVDFDTDTNNGIYFLIDITCDGVKQNYFCKNCLPNSPSIQLGLLYLDSNMDWIQDLPGLSNCKNSCEFVKGNLLDLTNGALFAGKKCGRAGFVKCPSVLTTIFYNYF